METVSKKPRGRPQQFAAWEYQRLESSHAQTRRGQQNQLYCERALGELLGVFHTEGAENYHYRWLADLQAMEHVGKTRRTWHPTILSELGRLLQHAGRDVMLGCARLLCHDQPPTQDALAWLRALRKGAWAEGDIWELAMILVSTVLTYKSRHPSYTNAQVQDALALVFAHFPTMEEDAGAHLRDAGEGVPAGEERRPLAGGTA